MQKRGLSIALAVVIGVALYINLSGAQRDPLSLAEVSRSELHDQIELVEAKLLRGRTSIGRLVAVYSAPQAVKPALLLNEEEKSLKEMADDALLVVNAGFFTSERKATGLLVSDGRMLNSFVPTGGAAGSGVLLWRNGSLKLLDRKHVQKQDIDGATLAIQAGPRIIEPKGKRGIRSDDGARANRTVIGVDDVGRVAVVVLYCSDGGLTTGPTLYELQHLLGMKGIGRHAPDLALSFALNLDGGPSSGLHLRNEQQIRDLPSGIPVHSVLSLRVAPR